MSKLKDQPTDKTVKAKILTFLTKLADDDTSTGVHIEKMVHAVDPRARTARVDQSWRAVLYRLDSKGAERTYVYAGTFEHDTAIERAQTLKVSLNAVNGAVELVSATMPAPAPVPSSAAPHALPTAPSPSSTSFLTSTFNYALSDLTDELGFDPITAARLLAAQTEDEAIEIAADLENAWQQTAALGLAVGDSLDRIRTDLQLGTEPAPTTTPAETEDERIIEALKHPASKMQFTFVQGGDELRRIIEDGDFGAWRVFLHPEQERYADGHWNGPFRLTGGAGTGKTVVLLHRARALAERDPEASIVLTTYTRALGENLGRDLERLDASIPRAAAVGAAGVFVRGVDQLVVAVRDRAGTEFGSAAAEVLGATVESGASIRSNDHGWQDAIDDVNPDLPQDVLAASFFVGEYLQVILPARITTREKYFSIRRPGRGAALDRKKRDEVWKVVERYRRDAQLQNTISWAELAAVAAAWLDQHGAAADHVLIDEGQDLTPTHWQFLRALSKQGPNDLFIAEDTHQRIYGQHVVLSRYGIAITGRARRLTLNYRTTEQNLQYALSVLEGSTYIDPEGSAEGVAGYRSARRGPSPEVHGYSTESEQLAGAADLIDAWKADGADPGSIAVLTRTNDRAHEVQETLQRRGLSVEYLKSQKELGDKPKVLTMHTAKGMEFSRVILFDVSDGVVPAGWMLKQAAPADRDDVLLRERSLLYVASSRARDVLAITWKGKPSPLLSASSA